MATIVAKEWAEVFKNRLVLLTVLFLPLLLALLPFLTLAAMTQFGGPGAEWSQPAPQGFSPELCADLSELDCARVYVLNLFTLMFMIIPIVIPTTIASYSIVGEKTARSLEPLLATPITTTQLLGGKMLAAVLPAVVATWLAFSLYLIGARLMTSTVVFARAADPLYLLAVLVVSPLLALAAVSIAVMISSRVSDPRVAEQLTAIVVLPIILLIIGQSVGLILVDQRVIVVMGIVVAVVDVLLVALASRVFQRESVLTRWK